MMSPPVGLDMFEHYRHIAIDAVSDVRRQAPALGYLRHGLQQRIYLFPALKDARAWFEQRSQIAPGYDYVAVFQAKDLRGPLLEDFGQTVVTGCDPTQVGHWFLPLALGIPAGAFGGYQYRKWREGHPGKLIPWISGDDHQAALRSRGVVVAQHGNAKPGVGPYLGVELFGAGGSGHDLYRSFPSLDAASDWLATTAHDVVAYRAIYDATDPTWPAPISESFADSRMTRMSGGPSIVGITPRLMAFRRAAHEAVWHKREADGDNMAPIYLYIDRGGHGHVTGHQTVDDVMAYAPNLAALPGFRYAAAFHAGPWNLEFEGEATAERPVLASGDVVGTEPWVDIIGAEPVGAYPWASIHDLGAPRFVQRGPWLDIVGTEPWVDIVGTEPWVDIIGADADVERRRTWPRTRALIRSAMREVIDSDRRGWEVPWDVTGYVWSLNSDGTTSINPSWSPDAALAFFRETAYTRQPVAQALFDKTSSHWPNPVSWIKNPDPAFEGVIAQQVARHAPPRTAGDGASPWTPDSFSPLSGRSIVGEALDVLRRQAKIAADELPARVIGVRRDSGNRWQLKQFHSADDADDWFGRVTRDPASFTYAAYFDKGDILYPDPLNEKIGGARMRSLPGPSIPRGIGEVAA